VREEEAAMLFARGLFSATEGREAEFKVPEVMGIEEGAWSGGLMYSKVLEYARLEGLLLLYARVLE
jgi:hypothetical protein